MKLYCDFGGAHLSPYGCWYSGDIVWSVGGGNHWRPIRREWDALGLAPPPPPYLCSGHKKLYEQDMHASRTSHYGMKSLAGNPDPDAFYGMKPYQAWFSKARSAAYKLLMKARKKKGL